MKKFHLIISTPNDNTPEVTITIDGETQVFKSSPSAVAALEQFLDNLFYSGQAASKSIAPRMRVWGLFKYEAGDEI